MAVRCPAAGSYSLVSQGRSTHDKDGFVKTIASVEVATDSSSSVISGNGSSLQEFSVPRPCYLVDLTQVADNQLNSGFDLDLGRDQTINGKTFKGPDDYITQMAVGTVQQWDVTGADDLQMQRLVLQHVHVLCLISIQEHSRMGVGMALQAFPLVHWPVAPCYRCCPAFHTHHPDFTLRSHVLRG